jgi:hypothetical protein
VDQAPFAYQSFFDTSENAVKTKAWIAVSVYVLAPIVKKSLGIGASLNTDGGTHRNYP